MIWETIGFSIQNQAQELGVGLGSHNLAPPITQSTLEHSLQPQEEVLHTLLPLGSKLKYERHASYVNRTDLAIHS